MTGCSDAGCQEDWQAAGQRIEEMRDFWEKQINETLTYDELLDSEAGEENYSVFIYIK